MKELSIEEKAKAYDKAIKVINDNLGALNEIVETGAEVVNIQSIQNCFYKAFPELKESNDERIRKEILNYIDKSTGCKRWIAWLEKQSNTNTFDVPKISIKNAVEVTSRMQYIDDDIKPIAEFIIDYANWDLHKDEWNQPTLTVPLFRVLDALIQRGKPYCGCNQNIEKQGEQNPADGVELKFHKGDWVIDKQGFVHQVANVVENVTNHTYGYDIVGGGYFNDNAEGVRLWNISDAKDGDVLVDSLGNVCIYQEPSTKLMYHSHCYGNHKYFICIGGSHEIVGSYPATKEQRDQFEKVMADAGYAFDFEKKELKEIENEEYDGEDYGIDSLWHAKNILEKTLGEVEGYQTDDGILDHKCAITAVDKLYKEDAKIKNRWKPSDEQIKALEHFVRSIGESGFASPYDYNTRLLYSLLEQLKKI